MSTDTPDNSPEQCNCESESTYPPCQYSFFIDSSQVVLRAADGNELEYLMASVAARVNTLHEYHNAITLALAVKNHFEGDEDEGNSNRRTNSRRNNSSRDNSSRRESGPPNDDEEIPHCRHGEMNDCRGMGYKADFYCTLNTKDWKKKCKPVTWS